ncbi:MAG: hypothetical protein ABEJ23_04960 [Haloarculaceae archaeon]
MDEESNHADDESDRVDAPCPEPAAGDVSAELYETDDGVVLYDADNPLAWVQSTVSVRLEDQA